MPGAVTIVAPGCARPDVVSAAWDVLTARDEVASAGREFDDVPRSGQGRPAWGEFTAWRDGLYVPAHAALARAMATFTVLLGRTVGDPAGLAERVVTADIDASVSAGVRGVRPGGVSGVETGAGPEIGYQPAGPAPSKPHP